MSFRIDDKHARGEIASIGLMRGIASVMVCFFHLSYGNERLLPDSSWVKATGKWGWIGVEIFFVISGFVIPYAMFIKKYTISDMGTFLKKRIIRIEPPYLVSILLVIGLGYISTLMPFYRGAAFSIDWLNVAGHIAYLNVFTGAKWLQDIYWTLAIEFQYYLLMALAFTVVASNKMMHRVLFFALFIASIALKPILPFFIIGYASYFMMGILLFQYYCRICSNAEFWLLLSITAIVSFYSQGLVLTAVSLATLALIASIKKVHPVFVFLGIISYSLYLIHIPIGGRVINMAEAFISNVHVRELMVGIAMAICIIAAWLYYLFIEKRFKVLSAQIGYKPQKEKPVEGNFFQAG